MRQFILLAAAVLLTAGAPLAAQEKKKKEKPPIARINNVRVGFRSNQLNDSTERYKVGLWAPVYVTITAGEEGLPVKGQQEPSFLHIETIDSEDVGTIYTVQPIVLDANATQTFIGYVKTGNIGAEVKVALNVGGRTFTAPPRVNALALNHHLYLTLGGRLPDMEAAGNHLREILWRRRQRRRIVVAARNDFQILFCEVGGIAARVRNDLLHRDPARRIPVRPEDHVLHALNEDRRLMVERLADDDVHPERLVAGDRIGGPQAKERDVHEDIGTIVELRQPAHPLHRQLDLADAIGERHVDRFDRRRANHPIVLEPVARLEALDRLDQRLGEAAIHGVDQEPSPLVAHAHAAAGCGDRAGFLDAFEQIGLAGTNGDVAAEHDAEPGHRTGSIRSHGMLYGPG